MSRQEIFKTGEKLPEMVAQHFVGQAYLEPITRNGISNVTFEPACRNNWHIHHNSMQILLVTEGTGWYQEWDKEPVKLTKGDVVHIPVGAKHWHGASKDSWFAHLTTEIKEVNAHVEWLEPVDTDYYNSLV